MKRYENVAYSKVRHFMAAEGLDNYHSILNSFALKFIAWSYGSS